MIHLCFEYRMIKVAILKIAHEYGEPELKTIVGDSKCQFELIIMSKITKEEDEPSYP